MELIDFIKNYEPTFENEELDGKQDLKLSSYEYVVFDISK